MKCILIIGKKTKKKTKIKQNNKKRKKNLPLVTLQICNVTNGGSIGNVANLQRYQWNLH
jgi:hypothetical protein